MLDLEALSGCFGQALVIRYLQHQHADFGTEMIPQLFRGGFCIFNRIVKNGRYQCCEVCHAALCGQQRGDLYRMIDVWRSIDVLAPLGTVLMSRELECG